jgi:SAM-dependent methyltransferase
MRYREAGALESQAGEECADLDDPLYLRRHSPVAGGSDAPTTSTRPVMPSTAISTEADRIRWPPWDRIHFSDEAGERDLRNDSMRDARDDWRRFDAAKIPTKDSTPHLDRFLRTVQEAAPAGSPLALLDVGCGSGRLGKRLYEQGFAVTGVDISPDAVRAAEELAVAAATGPRLRFVEADFAADRPPRIDGGPFDVAVCQLVISIVGGARERSNLLRHIHDNLRPDGWLYLSASGVSDTINAGYARLYAEDVHLTGERHSYLSRDERGEVLYMTHHFTVDEFTRLLESAGFGGIDVTIEREASSRRPNEAAHFLYATCRP